MYKISPHAMSGLPLRHSRPTIHRHNMPRIVIGGSCSLLSRFCLLLAVLFLTTLTGCQSGETVGSETAVSIRVVYPPELADYMRMVKGSFENSEHRLSGGIPVALSLIEEHGWSAARKIARGELKTDAWISPSTSLVNYTNGHIINLGAPQVDCRPLFGSPVVVVTKEANIASFQAHERVFSWNDFVTSLRSRVSEGGAIESIVSFNIAGADFAASGVPALLQLAHFSLSSVEGTVTKELFESTEVKQRFSSVLRLVGRLVPGDVRLLEELSSSNDARITFGLITERQLAMFNVQHPAREGSRLVALYPREGSVWQDYSLCLSNADWVVPSQRAGVALLGSFLTARGAQAAAGRNGFRPQAKEKELLQGPLRNELGITLDAVSASALPYSSEVTEQILENWPSYVRPTATIVLLDVSGTTGQGPLYSGTRLIRYLVEKKRPREQLALMTFADKVVYLSELSENGPALLGKLEGLQAGGASALYQSINEAIGVASKDSHVGFRKNIILFTDGRDNKSNISLPDLIDTIKYRKQHTDFNLIIIAVQTSGVDLSDLDRIAEAAGGTIWKVPLNEVDRIVAEMYARYW